VAKLGALIGDSVGVGGRVGFEEVLGGLVSAEIGGARRQRRRELDEIRALRRAVLQERLRFLPIEWLRLPYRELDLAGRVRLAIEGEWRPKDVDRIARQSMVGAKAVFDTGRFETIRITLPPRTRQTFQKRPVCVQAASRLQDHRMWQFQLFEERFKRLIGFPLVVVAGARMPDFAEVYIEGKRPDFRNVVSFAIRVGLEGCRAKIGFGSAFVSLFQKFPKVFDRFEE